MKSRFDGFEAGRGRLAWRLLHGSHRSKTGSGATGKKNAMTLSHSQQDLQQRARALARETIAPRAAEVDRTEQYPWQNVKALADAGFFGMTIPKPYGGLGLGFLEASLVVDEVAQVCGVSGRIVVGSWYGEKPAEIDLGSTFHRSRIKLLSSQVSSLSPELSGRWDKQRRFDVAWQALERIRPEKWITHRFAIDQAADAYHLLDQNPQEALQVILEYKS